MLDSVRKPLERPEEALGPMIFRLLRAPYRF